jgi:hypothetical protein
MRLITQDIIICILTSSQEEEGGGAAAQQLTITSQEEGKPSSPVPSCKFMRHRPRNWSFFLLVVLKAT